MSYMNVSNSEFGPGQHLPAEQVTPGTAAEPSGRATSMRARLTAAMAAAGSATRRAEQAAGPPLQRWYKSASQQALILIKRARTYPAPVVATLATAAAVLFASRRRANEPVIDESSVDLGNWHLSGHCHRLDKSA
jgi:hypothetical protein